MRVSSVAFFGSDQPVAHFGASRLEPQKRGWLAADEKIPERIRHGVGVLLDRFEVSG